MISGNKVAVTASAPPMTSARLGSQTPKMSRKPMIFCGLVMPESTSPKPKRTPPTSRRKAGSRQNSDMQQVPEHEYGCDTGGHEHGRRHERARGSAGESADAMTARAAGAVAGDPHRAARQRDQHGRVDGGPGHRVRHHGETERAARDQSGDEAKPPSDVADRGSSTWLTMPETPAMRPLSHRSSVAAAPIRSPPARAGTGANSGEIMARVSDPASIAILYVSLHKWRVPRRERRDRRMQNRKERPWTRTCCNSST